MEGRSKLSVSHPERGSRAHKVKHPSVDLGPTKSGIRVWTYGPQVQASVSGSRAHKIRISCVDPGPTRSGNGVWI